MTIQIRHLALAAFASSAVLAATIALPATPACAAAQASGGKPAQAPAGYRIEQVREGLHDGAPVRFVDVTLRNTTTQPIQPDGMTEVWWQGPNYGKQVLARKRDLSEFRMHDWVKPGQTLAVTYVIPLRDDVDGVTIEDLNAPSGPAERKYSWEELSGPKAAAVAPPTKPAPRAAPGALTVPAGAASFATYGPWEFKVDEMVRGPDGHIQAVVTARNASRERLPFTITDFDAYLVGADGRTVRRLGNLYRVTPTGPVDALVTAGSSYLEPGDEIRGRLLFHPTKGFQPVELRLKEPVVSQTETAHAMP